MTSARAQGQAVAVRTVLRVLRDSGLAHLLVAPGSRSTPLVQAAAELEHAGQLRLWPVLDERAAAFAAIGMNRAGHCAAVLTTSGSATGHLLPAMMEAHASRTPIIALTADRPVAVRGLGAPQTVDQVGVYGACAATLEGDFSDPAQATRLANALSDALSRRTPLHINVALDVPLALASDAPPLDIAMPPQVLASAGPSVAPPQPQERVLVICGPLRPSTALRQLWSHAVRTAVVAAEISSGLAMPSAPRLFDAYLRDGQVCAALLPDRIVRLGEWPVGKGLQLLLSAAKAHGIAVDVIEPGRRSDPELHQRMATALAPELALADWHHAVASPQAVAYAAQWQCAETAAGAAADARALEADFAATEPGVIAVVAHHVPADGHLHVANSMAIRDLDAFSRAPLACTVGFARGTNGIDGTLAAAWGHAVATGQPTWVLLGDTAFLHDLNSLALVVSAPNLRVVVVDNRGGAIFDYLPARTAMPPALHERMFRQPHSVDLAAVARAFGISAVHTQGAAGLASALTAPQSPQCIVVQVEPARSELVHRRWQTALAAAACAAIDRRRHLPMRWRETVLRSGLGLRAAGDPKLPPVLLLHGFFADSRAWAPMVQHLTRVHGLRRRWLALDLPGHGLSARHRAPDGGDVWPWLRAGIAEFVQQLDQPTVMVGYSLGGRIAASCALTPQSDGSLLPLRALVLESAHPGLGGVARVDRQRHDAELALQLHAGGLEAFAAYWRTLPMFAGRTASHDNIARLLDNLRTQQDPDGLAYALAALGTGAMPDTRDQPPRPNLPTLLIAGAQDHAYVAHLAAWRGLLPDDTTLVAPCGHHVSAEATPLWAAAVAAHLAAD